MSAFTALNGTEKPAEATIQVADQVRPASAGRINGQTSMASSGVSESAKAAESQKDSWSGPTSDRQSHYQQPPSYAESENPHKRKRSDTDEMRRDQPPPAPQDRSPQEAAVQSAHSEPRMAYESRDRDYRRYAEESRQPSDGWYASQNRDSQSSYESQQSQQKRQQSQPAPSSRTPPAHTHSDDPGSEPSRKEHGHSRIDMDYPGTSPDADDRSVSVYATSPYGERKDTGVIQVDPKKRKRNFSNRTKTGCLTCRKRKKKCDERKPECSNCVRGGFLCAGYPPQTSHAWQKPDNKAAAIPLESKDPTYVPPGAYGMPQQQQSQGQQQPSQQQPSQPSSQQTNPYATPTSATATQQLPQSLPQPPQKRESLTYPRGQPLRIDPPQGRPLVTDDDRQTASTIPSASVASPDNKLSALSYTPGASMYPTPISANSGPAAPFSERGPKEYQRVPPLHDLTRTDPDASHHGTTLPQINVLHPTRTNSPITQHQAATSSAQVAAQLALAHTPYSSNRTRTQKEEMLAGRHFYPFDKELVLERERCNAACWRFNNSMNPATGVSPSERARLFREILQPRDAIQIPTTSPVSNIGRLGESVVVEAPFTCDYGYNISIGQNVVVGRNCTIQDTCEVKIGENCLIGPNVGIYTTSVSLDPKRRMGSKGPQIGKPITIEADCFIGAGAMILPGRTIGKGSTVGAGAVVTKDVPPFTIVVGTPAKVLRGVSS